ncbi:MAG: hypothetical protein JO257_15315 [Deltaproteobacteria bacterium]|nr:hypothetical protein [Deltaproteobacteria bacterium]
MESVESKLAVIGRHADRAAAAVREDRGASPVLAAVVDEFAAKAKKLNAAFAGADAATRRELIVEVEQAGDSAKAGAGADTGISKETKHLIVLAHDSFCLLKAESK